MHDFIFKLQITAQRYCTGLIYLAGSNQKLSPSVGSKTKYISIDHLFPNSLVQYDVKTVTIFHKITVTWNVAIHSSCRKLNFTLAQGA